MKKIQGYTAALLMLGCATFSAGAQQILGGDAYVSNVNIGKIDDRLVVSMDIAPAGGEWNIESDRTIILTPAVEKDGFSISLPQIQILGRNQYIRHQRNASKDDFSEIKIYRASKTQSLHYAVSESYEEWMDGSELVLKEDLCGCTRTLLSSGRSQLERYEVPVERPAFRPVFAYLVPKAEAVKERSESGQAYVTFHASKTDIDDTYLNNREELQKILNTVALVQGDADVTITGIELKGYASPEGKYQINEKLAKDRTDAVARYIKALSRGADYAVTTASEAENWEGLKEFLINSDLSDKENILAIIDSPAFAGNPDGREWKIKSTYPEAYRTLLTVCYPSLRRTDYRVEYTIRSFSLEEAKLLVMTQPQKLSLQEMYNVAQTFEPGSDDYNEVFETAVRMFPDDETANLNAANSALQRGDTLRARKYLSKAGDSGEAVVARGILAMMEDDAVTATEMMLIAKGMGIEAASANLEQIQTITK